MHQAYRIVLGQLPDIAYLYAPEAPGVECLRSLPVVRNEAIMEHFHRDHQSGWHGSTTSAS